jgi:hypothetical protein
MQEDPEGAWGDAWYYEDRLIYVHKRRVAIANDAVREGPKGIEFDRSNMVMAALTYDEMRKGCYDRDARISDLELNWRPAPTTPPLSLPLSAGDRPSWWGTRSGGRWPP